MCIHGCQSVTSLPEVRMPPSLPHTQSVRETRLSVLSLWSPLLLLPRPPQPSLPTAVTPAPPSSPAPLPQVPQGQSCSGAAYSPPAYNKQVKTGSHSAPAPATLWSGVPPCQPTACGRMFVPLTPVCLSPVPLLPAHLLHGSKAAAYPLGLSLSSSCVFCVSPGLWSSRAGMEMVMVRLEPELGIGGGRLGDLGEIGRDLR